MMEPQHQYTDVRHHDDDSSTEVESLVGGGKEWTTGDYHSQRLSSRRRVLCPPIIAALRWILIIGLQLVIIALLARDQGLLDSTRWRGRSTSANEVGGDITGWGPHSMYLRIWRSKLTTNKSLSPNADHQIPDQPNIRPLQYIRVL